MRSIGQISSDYCIVRLLEGEWGDDLGRLFEDGRLLEVVEIAHYLF